MPSSLDLSKKFMLIAIGLALNCCAEQKVEDPIVTALNSSEESAIRQVMESPEKYELQIHYTQIIRDNGKVAFKEFTYQQNDSAYFYPASTVKFPIAVLALEKLSRTPEISLKSSYYVEGDTVETNFASDIIKVFAVSDNEANNRLFEFLGQDEINDGLKSKGVGPVRISHRLSTANADDISTKALIVYLNDSTTTMIPPTINLPLHHLQMKGITKGNGYMEGDSLIAEPFDFSLKNYYPISTQHHVLKRVIFPDLYKVDEQFQLGVEERGLLLSAMSELPRAQGYDPSEYYDSYVKFFMFGDKEDPMPANIKIFNKVGYAYGTLTDCAYIQDMENGVEFLLTATILVNDNGIFNDNTYEYETVGIPFLAALGREIYQYELNRK